MIVRDTNTSALRRHNNDVGDALTSLTSSIAGNPDSGDSNEALAVLQSLGVPPEAAREVLGRTGTLCNALRELGIDAPQGSAGIGSGSGGARKENLLEHGSGSAGEGGSSSEGEGDEGSEGEGEEGDLEPTPEEMKLYDELAADRANQEEEGYLDVTLEDEADAADMWVLCVWMWLRFVVLCGQASVFWLQ